MYCRQVRLSSLPPRATVYTTIDRTQGLLPACEPFNPLVSRKKKEIKCIAHMDMNGGMKVYSDRSAQPCTCSYPFLRPCGVTRWRVSLKSVKRSLSLWNCVVKPSMDPWYTDTFFARLSIHQSRKPRLRRSWSNIHNPLQHTAGAFKFSNTW